MPEDQATANATLKDTLVSDQATDATTAEATTATTQATEELKPIRIVEVPDPAAAELGAILANSGWTKANVNDLLQSPTALESLKNMIQNNPQEFLNMVERADPRAAERLLDTASDEYLRRNESKGGKSKDEDSSGLQREVETLREKTNRLEADQQRREQAIATQAMRQRLDARVDDLLGQVKDLGLKPSETKNLRARVYTELASDATVAQRVSNGNFVDVPRVFQTLIDEKVADQNAAVQAEKDKREGVQRGAYPEFSLGAQANIPPDLLEKSSGSWDDTEAALAKALTGTR
jgi:hypothetical protein